MTPIDLPGYTLYDSARWAPTPMLSFKLSSNSLAPSPSSFYNYPLEPTHAIDMVVDYGHAFDMAPGAALGMSQIDMGSSSNTFGFVATAGSDHTFVNQLAPYPGRDFQGDHAAYYSDYLAPVSLPDLFPSYVNPALISPATTASEFEDIDALPATRSRKARADARKTKTKILLDAHAFQQHLGLPRSPPDSQLRRTCTVRGCGKSVVTTQFIRHLRTHRPSEYACSRCDRVVSRKDALKRHEETYH